jgi:glucose/arabinose dehydrogenase
LQVCAILQHIKYIRKMNRSAAGWPVDIGIMSDGSLLVSDDRVGAIYRIAYTRKY